MTDLITIGVIALGIGFLLFGAVLSSYGVSALGIVVGGSVGYLVAPTIAGSVALSGPVVIGIAVGAGALVGLLLSYFLLSVGVALMAFILGSYIGLTVVTGFVEQSLLDIPVAIATGLVFGAIGLVLTKTMMVILTSFVGAALASMAITATDFERAAAELHPEPLLFEVTAPVFLAAFVLGLLSQFGLFKLGYVTRVLTIVPGIRPLRNRGDAAEN